METTESVKDLRKSIPEAYHEWAMGDIMIQIPMDHHPRL